MEIGSINNSISSNLSNASERLKLAKQNLQSISVGKQFQAPTVDAPQITRATDAVSKVEKGSFGDVLRNVVETAETKRAEANQEVQKVLTGESDNLHRAVIAQQEAGVAFNMMLEMRNKLMEGYQELLRMQV